MPEAGEACGRIEVLAIDLDARYMDAAPSPYYYVTEEVVRAQLLSRPKFGHKGTFGHVLLVCGSEGMMGAGILAAAAALRSGCGLVTLHLPIAERMAVQVSSPSALLSLDPGTCFSVLPRDLTRYASIGIGCGMGQAEETVAAFETLLRTYSRPVVLDADAFSVFKQQGIYDQATAESFRKNILEKGGSEHPMILYKRFRGQEPTIDALLERSGLKSKSE